MNVELVAQRINRGLSVQAFADKFDVSKQTVWSWEKGDYRPRPATAKKIADYFGCKVTDIWPVKNGDEVAA